MATATVLDPWEDSPRGSGAGPRPTGPMPTRRHTRPRGSASYRRSRAGDRPDQLETLQHDGVIVGDGSALPREEAYVPRASTPGIGRPRLPPRRTPRRPRRTASCRPRVVRMMQTGSPAPSRPLYAPTRGRGSPCASYSESRPVVARFGPSRTRRELGRELARVVTAERPGLVGSLDAGRVGERAPERVHDGSDAPARHTPLRTPPSRRARPRDASGFHAIAFGADPMSRAIRRSSRAATARTRAPTRIP